MGEKNHVSIFFFWICSQILSTRFFASQDAKSTWGVRPQQHFFAGCRPNKCFLHGSVEGGVGSDEDAKCTQNGSAPRKGHIPSKMRIFSESKRQKKHNHHQHLNNGSGQSRIETGARTNSTPTPAPTDDRQLAVRYRYRDGLEVPHIVRLREPLDLALIRNAAALEQNPAG